MLLGEWKPLIGLLLTNQTAKQSNPNPKLVHSNMHYQKHIHVNSNVRTSRDIYIRATYELILSMPFMKLAPFLIRPIRNGSLMYSVKLGVKFSIGILKHFPAVTVSIWSVAYNIFRSLHCCLQPQYHYVPLIIA